MEQVSIIGIDLAKRSFSLHGARSDGSVAFRRTLSRPKVLGFLKRQPRCIVAMEACGSSHYWGREIAKLGHEVRLLPPIYVKPFVKRQKNDAADAEAIAEAASRPTMRFVAVKTEEQQSHGMMWHARSLFVRQRTQTINALRGHLAEFGLVAPQGTANVRKLEEALLASPDLPDLVHQIAADLLQQIDSLNEKIGEIDSRIRTLAKEDEDSKRLMSIPGVGPLTASAIHAFAPPMENFRSGRDFAAWLGLTPREDSTGGKVRLGRITKMGQRDIRRVLIIGAMSVVRLAKRRGAPKGSWLARMLATKPPKLVAVALANKIARTAWALLTKKEFYQAPTIAPAAN